MHTSDPKPKPSPEELKRRIEALSVPAPDFEPSKRRSGWRNLLGCLFWPVLFVAVLFGGYKALYAWHPWAYASETVATGSEACPDGGKGVKTVEYLEILGVRIEESGQATVCVDP